MTQPSNRRPNVGRRRPEEMKFAYSGPFHYCGLLSRVGRSFAKPYRDLRGEPMLKARYSATSAENYTIGAALGPEVIRAIVAKFGREDSRTPQAAPRGASMRLRPSRPRFRAPLGPKPPCRFPLSNGRRCCECDACHARG